MVTQNVLYALLESISSTHYPLYMIYGYNYDILIHYCIVNSTHFMNRIDQYSTSNTLISIIHLILGVAENLKTFKVSSQLVQLGSQPVTQDTYLLQNGCLKLQCYTHWGQYSSCYRAGAQYSCVRVQCHQKSIPTHDSSSYHNFWSVITEIQSRQ